MANQPKKYKKFVATAATATLVASAIVPVASAASLSDIAGNTHEEAITALVDAGVVSGYTDGTFKPNKTLTRSDVVKLLGKYLVSAGYEVPSDYKTNMRFNDLKSTSNDELLQYAAVVADNGVFNGSNGKLLAGDNITRENMAIVLVRMINTLKDVSLEEFVASQNFSGDVKDLNSAKAEARTAIQVLDFYDITNPSVANFNPKGDTTRGQFATFLHKTINTDFAGAAVTGTVKAINATTVEVTFGEDIADIKSLDFAIEGLEIKNEVVKQTDSKTVVLTTAVQESGKEYTVTVNGESVGKFTGVSAVIPTGVTVSTTSVQGVVGQQVSVQAEVKVAEGQSKAGIPVTFNVDPYDVNSEKVSSLNKAQVVEVLTDDKGVATYKYTQYNAGADQVVAYATGNASSRDFAKVYWGVKPILTLATKDGVTVENGKAKTYTATYLDAVTGTPLSNRELNVTFKENIDASVTNDSSAVATDVTTGSTVKPYESATNQVVLKVKTNSKGEATFTVTGSNTEVTPIVYLDSDALNTAGYNRINTRDLQATTETTKFVGGVYTFKFNKEEQFEAVVGKPFTYEVEVLKADGKPFAGGTATVALHELIDSSLATNTTAYIVNNSKVKAIPGKAGIYTIQLDSNGKAKFDVQADRTEVSATPVVWVDINSASNIEGTLEKEEAFKLAGSVVFRNEVIGGALLENTSDVTGIYGVSGTGLQQPNYEIRLLDQAGTDYSKNDYAVNRVTYTLTNTGNSAVTLALTSTNFTIDTISNNNPVTNLVIAAGGSVTVTGSAIGHPKNVALAVSNSSAGTVNVVGSVTTSVLATNGTWTNHNSYYTAGTETSQWVSATPALTEVTGVVKGYQTVDGTADWGYALVLVDGTSAYQIVKYGQSNSFFTGTQTDFNRLTSTDANGFERAISLEDRFSLKNSEIRLINVDASNKVAQAKGNGAGVINTEITQAIVDAVNNASNVGQVKTALKAVSAANALSDADQNIVAASVLNARNVMAAPNLFDIATLTSTLNDAIVSVYTTKVNAVNAASTYADLITAVKAIPGAAASVTALEAITDTAVQTAILGATFTGTDAVTFNASVTAVIASAIATVNSTANSTKLTTINTALSAVTSTTDTAAITAAITALNDNASALGLSLTEFAALTATQKALVIDALGSIYANAAALQTDINKLVVRAADASKPTITTVTTSGDTVIITFNEAVTLTGTTGDLEYSVGSAQGTVAITGATVTGNKLTLQLTPGTTLAVGNTVTAITGLTVADTALVPNTATLTGLSKVIAAQ